jgi:hypothetical protein
MYFAPQWAQIRMTFKVASVSICVDVRCVVVTDIVYCERWRSVDEEKGRFLGLPFTPPYQMTITT